jgi:hypothetical protein
MPTARLFICLFCLCSFSGAADDPFVGSWKASLARSKPDPNHKLQSATLRFEVAGDVVWLTSSGVNAAGKLVSQKTELRPDGRERDAPGAPGIMLVTRRPDARTLEMLGKKDGVVISRAVYAISRDGRTLTAKVGGVDDKNRPLEHYIVFERE